VNLRIPGPTPVPPEVLAASARQMIDHRGPEFGDLLKRLTRNLQTAFQTTNDVLLLTGSGSGGMEAAIVNTLSPGDRVIAVTVGAFGDRFAQIAEAYGAQVHRLEFPWGQPADPDVLRRTLHEELPQGYPSDPQREQHRVTNGVSSRRRRPTLRRWSSSTH
jgi:aspartate aminotransferase-like enzyme